ncbi:major tail protein [Rhodococcus phage ReqiPine5]|uniref:Gp20 n=1 Tax=Rhodococcus phage ReqiPine5 TaxID=691963 RepID=D4P7Z5_9CAUD|nr:major tail protein [Rhodococcus phage ReqiPine5]ADD81125.1 gp20 [Rhodococcus phage ReqiPine5]
MAEFPVVKGHALRATRVNSCGLPIEGPLGYLATKGFVSFAMSPVMKDAEELTQNNAEGRECVSERTPPERKWYNLTLTLCGVNTALIAMFSGWEQVLDWEGNAVGFRDQKEVESDYGVAIEIWSGGSAEDDCAVPDDDTIFDSVTSGKSYGYFLTFGKEWTLGDIEISAAVANFTLTGISFAAPQWGRGPWNVVPTDASGTPGRLITALNNDQHYEVQRTSVAPPAPTPAGVACPLAIKTLFTAPSTKYFGADAVDVAPAQAACVATP